MHVLLCNLHGLVREIQLFLDEERSLRILGLHEILLRRVVCLSCIIRSLID